MIKQTKFVQIQMDWYNSINNSIKKQWLSSIMTYQMETNLKQVTAER
jgi:hypothetical protein